ncbi:HypC/HybG/HupF family hydrogenase formation chaperone [Halothermothrix orenii]|uniref:Hydrogenase assembly chaperone hypC/hupF n=1 Tax=Halothermothrix orenii (strain H 168 / OCM 544 / DSM 9562) TaxID=373903 RepID=B8D1S2_HALOH|nr:HypC/HybG/HupF family hydrogenase formation chaperone [Halothermothrix orenii]ACL69149.1 hydrogenase assembly chaperone hypC/hupF [Halothermothrix orenii H 168]
MCIGVPVKIIKKRESLALAELNGVKKEINIDLVPEVKPGDYVLLHAGCAIQVVNKKEAIRTLKLLKELSQG